MTKDGMFDLLTKDLAKYNEEHAEEDAENEKKVLEMLWTTSIGPDKVIAMFKPKRRIPPAGRREYGRVQRGGKTFFRNYRRELKNGNGFSLNGVFELYMCGLA